MFSSSEKNTKLKSGRVFVFIDAANLWEAQKAKGRFFDYEKLRLFIRDSFKTVTIDTFYYTAYPAEGTRDYNLDGRHKFYTYLKKGLGFTVRKKELKRIKITTEEGEAIEEKGNKSRPPRGGRLLDVKPFQLH
jgi:hypothetical protein